jgi:hypothetical protein
MPRIYTSKYPDETLAEAAAMLVNGAPWSEAVRHSGMSSRGALAACLKKRGFAYHRGIPRLRGMRMSLERPATDLSYLAGIIDGEGCISRIVRRDGREITYQIVVANTSWPLMEWLQQFGGAVRLLGKAGTNKRTKDIYKWVVTGFLNIQAVLQAVRPYLVVKADIAKMVIDEIEARKLYHSARSQQVPGELHPVTSIQSGAPG